ncbi:hypothetical protein QOZ99_004114 [Angulomicrobium amanitiforme]|uniref:Uncharacterized protein n=1 Tax=Ancylobacter amanitiformis TaxID=217069 RepID=A0ABU0LWW2_9HYPH|nr:hypothetical protein [Ancylobacter amanitiformis]
MARWVLAHADKAARNGPGSPSHDENSAKIERIQAVCREFQTLASEPGATPSYADFEAKLHALRDQGVFPDERLIFAFAQAIHRGL